MKKQIEKPKMYVVRKYVKAMNVKEAIRKEPSIEIHDVYLDTNWSNKELSEAIGFDDGNLSEE
jgi:hypothetical protein